MARIYAFLAFFALPLAAHAEWKELRCANPNSGEQLIVTKHPAGTFRVATQNTQMYLLGLSCDVPKPEQPFFRCEGPEGVSVNFQSSLVREQGWPKDEYTYVDRVTFRVFLRYYYENSQGENVPAEREWAFDKSQCGWK
jgi:hypothetical protein